MADDVFYARAFEPDLAFVGEPREILGSVPRAPVD
jgi:hypothetical protein